VCLIFAVRNDLAVPLRVCLTLGLLSEVNSVVVLDNYSIKVKTIVSWEQRLQSACLS